MKRLLNLIRWKLSLLAWWKVRKDDWIDNMSDAQVLLECQIIMQIQDNIPLRFNLGLVDKLESWNCEVYFSTRHIVVKCWDQYIWSRTIERGFLKSAKILGHWYPVLKAEKDLPLRDRLLRLEKFMDETKR